MGKPLQMPTNKTGNLHFKGCSFYCKAFHLEYTDTQAYREKEDKSGAEDFCKENLWLTLLASEQLQNNRIIIGVNAYITQKKCNCPT